MLSLPVYQPALGKLARECDFFGKCGFVRDEPLKKSQKTFGLPAEKGQGCPIDGR